MDGKPIARSEKLLLQIGSMSRPTGWRSKMVEHEGDPALEVVSFGAAPWQISEIDALITLRNPRLSTATALDANGMALRPVPTSRSVESMSFRAPKDALYVIIE